MPTVFLSYSRDDLPLIEQLEAELKAHPDISIWRDQDKIYGGQKWPKVLGEAIADQDVFLLAWSKNAASSYFVEFEWCTAIALKKTIVPYLLDETPLAPSLRTFHGYRLADGTGLIQSLQAAPLGDVQRREPVIRTLSEITATEATAVLAQARAIFAEQQWSVQGNVYQAARDIHIHEAPAQPKLHGTSLRGRVFFIKDSDDLSPATDVRVALLQTAEETTTNSHGLFVLPLPSTFHPGTKVEIGVMKDDWVIYAPIDGEITIPALDSELVRIRLVKKGSHKLWSTERIEKFIRDTVERSKEQVRPEGNSQEIDFNRYIKEWAIKYGFSAQQAKAEIDKWVAEAEQGDDPYELGLAAYTTKHFAEAGRLFEKSATKWVRRAREASATAQQLTEKAIRDFQLAGDAHTNNYRFDQALTAYQHARELIRKDNDPHLWAELTLLIGSAQHEIGTRTEGDRIHHHLGNAVEAHHAALTVYTKAQLPHDWARTQNDLGIVLGDQGIRIAGKAGTELLADAQAAHRAALTVLTKTQFPYDWATIQNNLGNVLRQQGTRTGGVAGTQLLAQAVDAYREALTVYTKAHLPQGWAMTQNNLGNVLSDQGMRIAGKAGTKLLSNAVAAYRAALTVYTKRQLPQAWAMTQNNLGNVLSDQSMRIAGKAGTKLLSNAVAAYRAALTVYTKRQLPQAWAMTQNNLGTALRNLGMRTPGKTGTRLLARAVDAYRTALRVHTKNILPLSWAMIQNNLGTTLSDQGVRIGGGKGRRLLRQGIEAYRYALQVRKKDALPIQWMQTQNNLKEAEKDLVDMR